MRSLRANTALEQLSLFRHFYFVAAERELALAMALHGSHTFHQLPKNVSLCLTISSVICLVEPAARAANLLSSSCKTR
jgi:hypothetical protein